MKQVTVATIVCAALGVWSLRAETAGTESNYDRLMREGRNVWRFKRSANNNDSGMLTQTNALGQWAFPCEIQHWANNIQLNIPSGEASRKALGFGVFDLVDAVIVDASDTVRVDLATTDVWGSNAWGQKPGTSWMVTGFFWHSLQYVNMTELRCNRLQSGSGSDVCSGNTNITRVTVGGPMVTEFNGDFNAPAVTSVAVIDSPNLVSIVKYTGSKKIRSFTFDNLPKLTSFAAGNWPLREVVFLGKPFAAACMTNLLKGVETEAANTLSGTEPCRVYVSKRQWPYAERVASGYWKPATAESGLTEEELAQKPGRCLGIVDVSPDANKKRRAWVIHRASPYDKPGFCVLVR